MDLYSGLRDRLSITNKGRLSKLLILLRIKPSVNTNVKSIFSKGIVVFSADFELSWAFRYSKTLRKYTIIKGIEERENFPVILSVFENFEIPITWATVGHLFLQNCYGTTDGIAHEKMPRPAYFENRNWIFDSGDWYDDDPCRNVTDSPTWYAPDLVEMILKSKLQHEIGCHTFSHIDFSDKNCSRILAEAEIDACIKLASEKGIRLRSMVFPGGTIGNLEVVKEKGLICYRKPMKYHIDLPKIDKYGLLAIPSSINLDKDPYGWSKEFHIRMIKNFIEKAAESKLICQFWFHPSMNKWYLENIFPEIIKIVAEYRNSGKINVMTMGQLADVFFKRKEVFK